MGLFGKRKKPVYDPVKQEPAVRRSICTGEMTVGFIEKETGRFHDLMKVNGPKELEEFCRSLGVKEIRTIY